MKLLGILLLTSILACSAFATNVCGNVSGTWTLANSPYIVTCQVTVPTGQTLIIEPGVHVLFSAHYKFIVNGTLRAIGTQADSIVFTRQFATEASKGWGVRFINASNSSQMEYCLVEQGKATGSGFDPSGGGILCITSSPLIRHCKISNNHADYAGGGMYCDNCSPTFEYCVFSHNTNIVGGGGVNIHNASPIFRHCIINANNCTQNGGGAYYGGSGFPTFINCDFVANTAGQNSGGIYALGSFNAVISNCIIWLNTGTGAPANGIMTYTDIQGGYAGTGNINSNPLFIDSANEIFGLTASSPCIDTGNPASPADSDGTRNDMGAIQFHHPPLGRCCYGDPYGPSCSVNTEDVCLTLGGSWITGQTCETAPCVPQIHRGRCCYIASGVGVCATNTEAECAVFNGLWNGTTTCELSVCDEYLPVEFGAFSAVAGDGSVLLTWNTISETNVASFTIERSTNAGWNTLTHVTSLGNSPNGHSYSFQDRTVTNGTTYNYRLIARDVDGSTAIHLTIASATPSHSEVIMNYSLLQNYPNPFNPNTSIGFDVAQANFVSLKIYNTTGHEVAELVNGNFEAGHHTVAFNAKNLTSGIYFYTVKIGNDFTDTKKMLLMK